MALNTNALCTVDQVKSYIGIEDNHKNDSIELYINAASEMINEYLGYDPETQTYTEEVYDGTGTKFLTLKARPITTLTEVQEDGDTVTITDFVKRDWYIDGDDYVFVSGNSNYKVTYIAGYSADDMPTSITLACVKIAAMMTKEDGRTGSLGTSSISHGDGSRTFLESTYDTILETLYTYRRIDG